MNSPETRHLQPYRGLEVTAMEKAKRFKDEATRNLMASELAKDPTVRPWIRKMFRLGARNIRHDWMFVRNPQTGDYDRLPDPAAFNADINQFVGVCLLRSRGGTWFLNGQ